MRWRLGLVAIAGLGGAIAWYAMSLRRGDATAAAPPAPVIPAVQHLAADWVAALNARAPQAFLAFSTDSFATLYLVPAAWWETLTPAQRCTWQSQYQARWQAYLRGAIGDWDSTTGFAPRLVALDADGQPGCVLQPHAAVQTAP